MSSSGRSCRNTRPRKTSKLRVSPETTSDLRSRLRTRRPAVAEKTPTAKTASRRPDSELSPVSPVSDTPLPQTTNVPENTATPSPKNALKGRRKTERSDRRTAQQKVTPPPGLQRSTRAAKDTSTLSRPGSQEDTPHKPRTPKRGRRPRPRHCSTPRRSRTPPSEPYLSPVTKPSPKTPLKSPNPETQPEKKRRRRRKVEQDSNQTPPIKRQRKKRVAKKAGLPERQRIRTRFVLQDSEHHEPDEALSSSDLSIELSVQEDKLSLTHTHSLEDDDDDEDEELPSFLQQSRQKPSIREGLCVWCKLRKYPFWPAMVKSVNHKTKKASIVFIDQFLCDKKTMSKGLSVSLRTLKPFDCEESHRFVDLAKEKYGESIKCCLDLISDYRIRLGCGSFVGSIVEYIADDISYPLRSEFLKVSSDLLSPTQSLMEEQDGDCELQDLEEHSDLFQDGHMEKKVLPDRTQAARKRANQKLVDFIVRKQGAENRLLAVISGQEVSRWLQALHSSSRLMLEQMYLEDDDQVDKVYRYLDGLCSSVTIANSALENSDRIRFILDVLFPEALICAIAAEDKVSLEKAEEKYRQGPRHSNRERQEFDLMIEQQMRLKETGHTRHVF